MSEIIEKQVLISNIINTKDIDTNKEYIILGKFDNIIEFAKYVLDTTIRVDGVYIKLPCKKDYYINIVHDPSDIVYTIFKLDVDDMELKLNYREVKELYKEEVLPSLVILPLIVTTLLYNKVTDKYDIIEDKIDMNPINGGYNYEKL